MNSLEATEVFEKVGRAFIVVDAELFRGFGIKPPDFAAIAAKLLVDRVGWQVVAVDLHDMRGVIVTVEGRGIPMNADGSMREAVVYYGYDSARNVHWLKAARVMCPTHGTESLPDRGKVDG